MITIFSCKPKTEQLILIEEIEKLEQKLYSSKGEVNFELASETLKKYDEFVEKYKTDSLSPEYLFKAASLANGIDDNFKALSYLQKIEKSYPNYEKSGTVLFQHAFILDNCIKDKNGAKEYYKKFVKQYPNHILAKDAENAIALLELTDEELINFLESNN